MIIALHFSSGGSRMNDLKPGGTTDSRSDFQTPMLGPPLQHFPTLPAPALYIRRQIAPVAAPRVYRCPARYRSERSIAR
jgi:hypothetical protein